MGTGCLHENYKQNCERPEWVRRDALPSSPVFLALDQQNNLSCCLFLTAATRATTTGTTPSTRTTDFDDYVYNGTSGCDFERNTALDDIDFGTFHLYPQDWAPQLDPLAWGLKYIQQHINSMWVFPLAYCACERQETYCWFVTLADILYRHKIGKPVLMEEFNLHGYTNQTTCVQLQLLKATLTTEESCPSGSSWLRRAESPVSCLGVLVCRASTAR